jgi:uncharacterized protein YlxP (DUF503 family)
MVVGALAFELHLPDVHSLKEKRAVAEQERWQRATVAMAVVSGTESHAREVLDAVERFVWSFPEVEVIDARLRWMEVEQ